MYQGETFAAQNFDLRNILKKGSKIATKFINSSEWINNTITEVGTHSFQIHLKIAYVINNVILGSIMTFKYFYENTEYVINGVVEEIDLYNSLIKINVYSIEEFSNQRNEPRFNISLCAYIMDNTNLQKPQYALIKNISRSGILFETKAILAEQNHYQLNIFLSRQRIISITCKILDKRSMLSINIYHAVIDSINENSIQLFEELISILEQYDEELLYSFLNLQK